MFSKWWILGFPFLLVLSELSSFLKWTDDFNLYDYYHILEAYLTPISMWTYYNQLSFSLYSFLSGAILFAFTGVWYHVTFKNDPPPEEPERNQIKTIRGLLLISLIAWIILIISLQIKTPDNIVLDALKIIGGLANFFLWVLTKPLLVSIWLVMIHSLHQNNENRPNIPDAIFSILPLLFVSHFILRYFFNYFGFTSYILIIISVMIFPAPFIILRYNTGLSKTKNILIDTWKYHQPRLTALIMVIVGLSLANRLIDYAYCLIFFGSYHSSSVTIPGYIMWFQYLKITMLSIFSFILIDQAFESGMLDIPKEGEPPPLYYPGEGKPAKTGMFSKTRNKIRLGCVVILMLMIGVSGFIFWSLSIKIPPDKVAVRITNPLRKTYDCEILNSNKYYVVAPIIQEVHIYNRAVTSLKIKPTDKENPVGYRNTEVHFWQTGETVELSATVYYKVGSKNACNLFSRKYKNIKDLEKHIITITDDSLTIALNKISSVDQFINMTEEKRNEILELRKTYPEYLIAQYPIGDHLKDVDTQIQIAIKHVNTDLKWERIPIEITEIKIENYNFICHE
jgi:hypothetical protein